MEPYCKHGDCGASVASNSSLVVTTLAIATAVPNEKEDKRRLLDDAALRELTAEANRPAKGELVIHPQTGKRVFQGRQTRTVFDSEIPSFAVRISPEGVATFCMVYSFGGQIRRFTIGRWRTAEMARRAADQDRGYTANDARKEARALRARIAGSRNHPPEDIAAAERARKVREREEREQRVTEADAKKRKRDFTFQALLTAYVEHLRSAGKPSASKVEGTIARAITGPYAKIAALPADEVTVEAVMPVFHRLAKAGKYREAEKLRAYLRAAYTVARKARTDATMHAFAGFAIHYNPLEELAVTRAKEAANEAAKAAKDRKWALSEAQLGAYWKRINALAAPHGALLRFHLLTGGQRVEQLSRLTDAAHDVDAKTVTLYDTKGRRQVAHEHVVPLLPEAESALAEMRQITHDKDGSPIPPGPFLFTVSNGREAAVYHTVRDWVRAVAEDMVKAKEVDRVFTPGTIRKTVETRLAAAGVSKDIRGRLQSHGVGGVQDKHYDAHDYDAEKREALRKLRRICEGKGKSGNVVPIRRKA